MQLTSPSRYVLEVSLPAHWPNSDRGQFLEELASEFLTLQGYRVKTRVRTAAAEIDLIAEHSVERRLIIAECKLHKNPIPKGVLEHLYARTMREEAKAGYLITTARLTSDAKGWLRDYERRMNEGRETQPPLVVLGPEILADNLRSARRLTIPQEIQTGEAQSPVLLVTETDCVWYYMRRSSDGVDEVRIHATQPMTEFREHEIEGRLGAQDHFPDTRIIWSRTKTEPEFSINELLRAASLYVYEHIRNRIVAIGTKRYTFLQASQEGRLYKRPVNSEVIAELAESGEVLLVGPEGSGKTTTVLMVAAEIVSDRQVLLGSAAEVDEECLFTYLRGISETDRILVILENVQGDERKTSHIIEFWRHERQQGAKASVWFILTTASYFGDPEEDEERENIFHLFDHVVKSIPDETEFDEIVSFLHESMYGASIAPNTLNVIRRISDRLLSVASLAVEGLGGRGLSETDPRGELQFREAIVRKVQLKYDLGPVMEEARQAMLLSLYGISIVPEAFGIEAAQSLRERGFLVSSPGYRRTLRVFAPGLARLWEEVERLEERYLTDFLLQYLRAPESNVTDVLLGLRRNEEFRLLYFIVNNGLQEIAERVSGEKNLSQLALTLEVAMGASRRAARYLLERVLFTRSVEGRVYRDPRPGAIRRFFEVATGLDRSIVPPRWQSDPSWSRLARFLVDEFSRAAVDPVVAAQVAAAIGRSSRSMARELAREIVSRRAALNPSSAENVLELLTFASEISVVDRQLSKDLIAGVKGAVIRRLFLEAKSPRIARKLLRSVDMLDRRKAQRLMMSIVVDRELRREWAGRMTTPETPVYDLAHLIFAMNRVSRRSTSMLVAITEDELLKLMTGLRKVSAVGFMLSVIRFTNAKVARAILKGLSFDHLQEALSTEWSALRVGKAISSLALVDYAVAERCVEGLPPTRVGWLLRQSTSLSGITALLRGLLISKHGSELVARALEEPFTGYHLQSVIDRTRSLFLIGDYASVGLSAGIWSRAIQRLVLNYLPEEKLIDELRHETNARAAGFGLKAYASVAPIGFYSLVDKMVATTAESPSAEDPQSLGPKKLKTWASKQDATDLAFLLRAALQMDGRLGMAIGENVSESGIRVTLERDSLARVSELLDVLSTVEPEKVGRAADDLLRRESILEAIKETRDLREFVGLLGAYRSINCGKWFAVMKGLGDKERQALERELSSRMQEETNLEIVGRALLLVSSFDGAVAKNLTAKQDWEWIKNSGRWNNQVGQVLFFLGAFCRCLPERGRYEASLRAMIVECFDRLGEVRGIWAVAYALRHVLRIPTRMGRLDIRQLFEERLPLQSWGSSVVGAQDSAGLITVRFMTQIFRTAGDKLLELGELATGRLRASLSAERPINTLAALAIVGTREDEDLWRGCARRVVAVRPEDAWATGYAKWLWRAERSLGAERVSRDALPVEELTRIEEVFSDAPEVDLKALPGRVGSNLYLFFLLYFLRGKGGARRDAEEVWKGLLTRRIRWEWRRPVRVLLESLEGREVLDGGKDWEVLAHTLEKVLPNTELIGEAPGSDD